MTPLPPGPFGCILADPPWRFVTFSGASAVPTQADDPYPTMTRDELRTLPVGDVAAKDCLLLIWTTSANVAEAMDLGRTWGFSIKSLGLVWIKARSPTQAEMFDDGPICDLGMGYWFRQQSEIQLLFTRGSPQRLSAGVRQVISEPRREHSRKPDEQYRRIEQLVGGPFLELFARQQRPGWTAWGNETDRFGSLTNPPPPNESDPPCSP